MPLNYAKVSLHMVYLLWAPINGNCPLEPKMRWVLLVLIGSYFVWKAYGLLDCFIFSLFT